MPVSLHCICLNRSLSLYFLPEAFDPDSIQAQPSFEPSFYFLSIGNNDKNLLLTDRCALLKRKASLESSVQVCLGDPLLKRNFW